MGISSTMSEAHSLTTWSPSCIPTAVLHAWVTQITPNTNNIQSQQLKIGTSGWHSGWVPEPSQPWGSGSEPGAAAEEGGVGPDENTNLAGPSLGFAAVGQVLVVCSASTTCSPPCMKRREHLRDWVLRYTNIARLYTFFVFIYLHSLISHSDSLHRLTYLACCNLTCLIFVPKLRREYTLYFLSLLYWIVL
jgi:hypothetical protein